MSFQKDPKAFWELVLGAFITIGGVFLAVAFSFGIETVKATNGHDTMMFGAFFYYYLIVVAFGIVGGILGASIRFLGKPWAPRR